MCTLLFDVERMVDSCKMSWFDWNSQILLGDYSEIYFIYTYVKYCIKILGVSCILPILPATLDEKDRLHTKLIEMTKINELKFELFPYSPYL